LIHIPLRVDEGEDVGELVTLAGQVGLAGHLQIGDNVMVGAQSGVGHDLSSGQAYSGSPAIPHREWLRMVTAMPKVPEMRKRLTEMEKLLNRIEETISFKKEEK
jgi:UDP-3-O-[3-hydroxymyristoyl] glucosamine N-acyltransferase